MVFKVYFIVWIYIEIQWGTEDVILKMSEQKEMEERLWRITITV